MILFDPLAIRTYHTHTKMSLPPSLPPCLLPSHIREYKTQVIQRDRIASCLLAEVEKKYKDQISVLHDVECVGLTWLDEEAGAREEAKGGSQQRRGVRVRLHRELEEGKLEQWTEDARWVIGADGVRSALRGALEAKTTPSPNNKKKTEKPVRAHKLPERNEFVYKILPLDLRPKYGTGPGWRPDLNYSARTKGEVTIEALPTKEGVYVGVVLFRPTCPAIAGIKDKEDARQFFAGSFPQFIDVIKEEDLARFATGPTFRLPSFSYAGPNINYKDNTLLLGDCIHSVKPYFGLGLNSALEDVMSLNRCLDETGDDLGKVRVYLSGLSLPGGDCVCVFMLWVSSVLICVFFNVCAYTLDMCLCLLYLSL
jgi:2-polyprenyl-6-methoxyphenol hydroxylase-like FAD-dependent oxidoreductase